MEKKLITITEDELWMWNYYAEGNDSSTDTESVESAYSEISLIAPDSRTPSPYTVSSQDVEFTPDNNEVLRRYQQEERNKPTATKTRQRILDDQRILHALKLQEDKDYLSSWNTMMRRNPEE